MKIRKKGILAVLVLIVLFFVLSAIFTNRWLENRLEELGTSIVGARVEFDGVKFSIFGLKLSWERLQVTNPNDTWRNLFETGKCEFDIDLEPLLSRKIVVENFQISELKFDTPRKTDGKVPKKIEPSEPPKFVKDIQRNIKHELEKIPAYNLALLFEKKVDVDSVIKFVNLQTPEKIDSLKEVYLAKYERWRERVNNLPDERELARYQEQIKSLKIDQIKTLEDLQRTLNTVQDLYRRTDSLVKVVKSIKEDFERDVEQTRNYGREIPNWIERDYERVLSFVQLPDLSQRNIARIIFGRKILEDFETASVYVQKARYYQKKLQSDKPEKEKPPRFKGQDIHFVAPKRYPSWWIKNIFLSGETNTRFKISGNVKNVVAQQKIVGMPTTFEIRGERKDGANFRIAGIFDYTGNSDVEKFEVSAKNIPVRNFNLARIKYFPERIESASMDAILNLNFVDETFSGRLRVFFNGVKYSFGQRANYNPKIVDIMNFIFSGLNVVELIAIVEKKNEDFKFSLNSNIDDVFISRIKQIATGEIERLKREIRGKVEAEITRYRSELDKVIVEKEKEIRGRIAEVEQRVRSYEDEVLAKKREIERKIEEEKSKAKKKIEEEIKKRLPKPF